MQLMDEARQKNQRVVRIDAKSLDLPNLEKALYSEDLFGESKLIVIDDLHSLPKSKRKDELIEMLATTVNRDPKLNLILWEKKTVTPTQLKKFATASAEIFKLTSYLFQWLDMLVGKRTPAQTQQLITILQKAIENDGEMMCFTMLIRQVRFLLQLSAGESVQLAPFMLSKLQKQAKTFSEAQLRKVHHHLLLMDVAQKTSQSWVGLAAELELLMMTM